MLAKKECVLCIMNQILRTASHLNIEPEKEDLIFRKCLEKSARIDRHGMTAPEFAEEIYGILTSIAGVKDPYRELRKKQNDLVMDRIDFFRGEIEKASDPLLKAGLYSLLGNIIDYGAATIFNIDGLFSPFRKIETAFNDYEKLKSRLMVASNLLIIGDNAGEAVFDRLFMEQIKKVNPRVDISYGIRSGPAINDVLKEDAIYVGIPQVARVVETGSTCAGTVVGKLDPGFRAIYDSADVVISKGQGNFETLEEEEQRDIFFILKVKCEPLARHLNLETGALLFAFGKTIKGSRPAKI